MKLLVCGSRTFRDRGFIRATLSELHRIRLIDCIIHGNAQGADLYAHFWAVDNGINSHPFKADWTQYGRAAGHIRNRQMLEAKPELVVAFTDKPLRESRGTSNMVQIAREANIEVIVHEVIL